MVWSCVQVGHASSDEAPDALVRAYAHHFFCVYILNNDHFRYKSHKEVWGSGLVSDDVLVSSLASVIMINIY